MKKRKIKYLGAIVLLSSIFFVTACVPYNDGYSYNNSNYGYGTPIISRTTIGIYDYPRYLDKPYYFYNNRYYYGGNYRNGYYYYQGHRYRHGHYYHRGYRYHHRRHRENVTLLKRRKYNHYISRDTYDTERKHNYTYQSHRRRNIDRLSK